MGDERPIGLHWGIKASFLEYIGRMSDGRGTVTDGATPTDGNIMVFEPDMSVVPTDPSRMQLFQAFRGDVRFAGHYGMLYVRIADPWVSVTDGVGTLTVLDPYKPDDEPRLPLVRFTLEQQHIDEDMLVWLSTDVHLTEEGTGLFNDVYQPGEPFEPLAIFLPVPAGTAASSGTAR